MVYGSGLWIEGSGLRILELLGESVSRGERARQVEA